MIEPLKVSLLSLCIWEWEITDFLLGVSLKDQVVKIMLLLQTQT